MQARFWLPEWESIGGPKHMVSAPHFPLTGPQSTAPQNPENRRMQECIAIRRDC